MDFNLDSMEKEARATLEAGKDKGHNELMQDLVELFQQAKALEYHDMLNTKHAMPKMELYKKLQGMALRTSDGDYDNA